MNKLELPSYSRNQKAHKVLDVFLSGKSLNQKQITHTALMEDSGRIVDFIRWKLLVPVECDDKQAPTVWFINDDEIYRYHHKRFEQMEEQQAKAINNKIERFIEWASKTATTEQGKALIRNAIATIRNSIDKETSSDKSPDA
jgi:hypothetical protein